MPILSLNKLVKQLRRAVLFDGGDVSDRQLLAEFIAQHDEAAFEALVKRHGPMVLGVCRRLLGNSHDVDDAFQATFLILVRKAASLESRELVGNWLYGVAYNTALAARAKNCRRRSKEKQVTEMPDPAVAPPDDWGELRPLLDQELSRLADVYREAIVLCDLEGKTRKEAAQKLGIPEGTMSSRLTTGRRQLADRLTRRGLTLSCGAAATILSQGAAPACVPTPLAASTVKIAVAAASGSAAAGAVSASVVALAEGVLKTMFLTEVKSAAAVALAFFLAAGLLVCGYSAAAPVPAQNKEEPTRAQSAPSEDEKKEAKKDEKKKGPAEDKDKLIYENTRKIKPQTTTYEEVVKLLGEPAAKSKTKDDKVSSAIWTSGAKSLSVNFKDEIVRSANSRGISIPENPKLTRENLDKIKAGTTTFEQVVKLLDEPTSKSIAKDGKLKSALWLSGVSAVNISFEEDVVRSISTKGMKSAR